MGNWLYGGQQSRDTTRIHIPLLIAPIYVESRVSPVAAAARESVAGGRYLDKNHGQVEGYLTFKAAMRGLMGKWARVASKALALYLILQCQANVIAPKNFTRGKNAFYYHHQRNQEQ